MQSKMRLLTPGPTHIPEEVSLALSRDMLHHRKPEFKQIMHEVQGNLKQLFATKEIVLPLSSSGTGAMQAAVQNLFSAGEKVLVVQGGKFGERWVEIAQKQGLKVQTLDISWGKAVQPEEVKEALEAEPDISGILVQASETSTGVLHPIAELGESTKDKKALLVVDGISAVGISPCPMDKWNIDCLLTGSQKGLMLPPGLSLIALSQKAWQKNSTLKSSDYYFDLKKEKDKAKQGETAYTSAISHIFALQKSLRLFLEVGLENIQAKYWALTQMARTGVKAMGLQPLVSENYTWGLTSVLLPKAVDGSLVLKNMAQDFNLVMAGGQGKLKGKIVRIGHMGHLDWADLLAGLYALEQSLSQLHSLDSAKDYLEQAMQSYKLALQNPGVALS